MQTVILTKLKEQLTFTSKQYEVGLYVIINHDSARQFNIQTTEEKYHKQLIRKAIIIGDTVISTSLPAYLDYQLFKAGLLTEPMLFRKTKNVWVRDREDQPWIKAKLQAILNTKKHRYLVQSVMHSTTYLAYKYYSYKDPNKC